MLEGLDEHAQIKLVEEFYFKDEKTFREAEQYYICRAIKRGYTLANKQHNFIPDNIVEKATKCAKRPKIAIREDATKKRFEIQIKKRNIDIQDQVKRFPWGSDKDSALKQAEMHIEFLYFKYY
jgi:hypothetical protein